MDRPVVSLVMADRDDSWYRQAACRGQATALFFPEPGEPGSPDDGAVAEAKAVCARCPVATRCLRAGLGEEDGIWGGLTIAERRTLRRGGQAA